MSWDRYAYVNNNPVMYNDPTGNTPCGDPYDPACLAWIEDYPSVIDYTIFDYVPVINNVRGIIRGNQNAQIIASHPNFGTQQNMLQDFYNDCYGQCHYQEYAFEFDPNARSNFYGFPSVPLVDEYSSNVGEIASNSVELIETLFFIDLLRSPQFEIKIGKNIRIAPFGNKSKNPAKLPYREITGNLPHFHLRIENPPATIRGGIGWHRPWDDLVNSFLILTGKK